MEPVMTKNPSSVIPADPLFSKQWHLLNTGPTQVSDGVAGYDINVTPVWGDYTGKGVLVAVMDDGFDETHPDLVNNYRKDLSWDLILNKQGAAAGGTGDKHGMSVAGLIAETANNATGGVGVAWDSQIVGYRSGLATATILSQFTAAVPKMLAVGSAISSNSWGPMSVPFDVQADQASYVSQVYKLVSQGRNSLGTVALFSAGNDREVAANSNYDPTDNIPFAISVAASKANGLITSYSTPGASVLVTAPGSDPASIITTDRQGTYGYNTAVGVAGNYTDTAEAAFNGTSAAAPIAAGVVALMLQANSNLGYRDVQEIFVYSSKRTLFLNQAGVDTTYNGAKDWNGGSLLTGYDFGYGNIDALAAVRMAETWQKSSTVSNLKITDGTVLQNSLSVAAGGEATAKATFSGNARVEQLTVTINLDSTRLQDVRLELISPNGTSSVLIDYPQPKDTDGNAAILPAHLSYTLDTVRDWGESLAGEWNLKLSDKSTGTGATLNSWSIKAYGSETANATAQIFTNEFVTFNALQSGRHILSSANGTEINASAVTAASAIDLSGGVSSNIGGVAVTLSDPQAFVKLIAGDGNDTLIGNALDNLLMGGRGNNILDGGAGTDTAQFIGLRGDYSVLQDGTGWKVVSNKLSQGGVDTVRNVEKLQFGQTVLVARSALDQTEAVGSMYDAMFNRAADATGLKSWTTSILDYGNSELAVARSMTRATEAGVNEWTNAQFVTKMYENAMDRSPDAAGYSYWLSLLDGGLDRGDMLLSFIDTDEFVENHLDMVASNIATLGDFW